MCVYVCMFLDWCDALGPQLQLGTRNFFKKNNDMANLAFEVRGNIWHTHSLDYKAGLV